MSPLSCRMNFGASRRCGDVKQFQRDTPKREALIWLGGPWNRRRPQNKVDYGPAGCDSVRLPFSRNDDEAMNLTDDELTDLTAELTGGDDTHRRPITDVNAWLGGLDRGTRPALRALGELLVGVAECDSTTRPEKPWRKIGAMGFYTFVVDFRLKLSS
jgi:cell division protease FtsH